MFLITSASGVNQWQTSRSLSSIAKMVCRCSNIAGEFNLNQFDLISLMIGNWRPTPIIFSHSVSCNDYRFFHNLPLFMFDFRAAIKEAASFSARFSLCIIQFVSPAVFAVSAYGDPTEWRSHHSAVASNCYEIRQFILCFLKSRNKLSSIAPTVIIPTNLLKK